MQKIRALAPKVKKLARIVIAGFGVHTKNVAEFQRNAI